MFKMYYQSNFAFAKSSHIIQAKILCSFILTFFCGQLRAANIDSLLDNELHINKPYIIINFTSSDCLLCRSGAVSIIDKFKDKAPSKIILLSDDKNMAIYYKQNSDIYTPYKKIYNKTLSNALAKEYFSTACIVQSSGVKCFLLNKINRDTLDYFESAIGKVDNSLRNSKVFTDSLINSEVPVFSYDQNLSLLLNRQFQFALVHDIKNASIGYAEPKINDTTVQDIYNMIRENIEDSLTEIKYSRKILKTVGLPQVIIKNVDNTIGRSVLFLVNTVTTEPMIEDTNYHYNIRGRVFMGLETKDKTNVLDITKYKSFIWIDSLHYGHDVLQPETVFNYEITNNNHYYLPFYKVDSITSARIQPVQEKIVEFTRNKMGKEQICRVFSLDDFGENQYNYFFRIDSRGYPIVVNEKNKVIKFLSTNKEIDFNKLIDKSGPKLAQIFDIAEKNDTLRFVGLLEGDICVKGSYCIKTGESTITKLGESGYSTRYSKMKIYNESIYAYRKNVDENKFFYDLFSF